MNRPIFFLFIVCLVNSFAHCSEPFVYFIPPKDWQVAHPNSLSPHVKIGFIASRKKGFVPSINLALELSPVDLEEYAKIVKKLHTADKSIHYYSLGSLPLAFGKAILSQIDMKNEYGEIRIMQLLTKYEDYALILSAASLKKDFTSIQEQLLSSFRSLMAYKDFYSSISESEKQLLQEKISDLKKNLSANKISLTNPSVFQEPKFFKQYWKPFEAFIQNSFAKYGIFWQILAINQLQNELINTQVPYDE